MSAFIVTPATMHRVVTAISTNATVFRNVTTEPTANLDKIGRLLFDLNACAVNGRYNLGPRQEAPTYRWKPIGAVSKLEAFYAVEHLHYQCSEAPATDSPLYAELTKLRNDLARQAAREAASAAKIPWGWE